METEFSLHEGYYSQSGDTLPLPPQQIVRAATFTVQWVGGGSGIMRGGAVVQAATGDTQRWGG